MKTKNIQFPFFDEIMHLQAGELVLINGTGFIARDQAHRKLSGLTAEGSELPADLNGSFIYYCGPTPRMPNGDFGSAGPTTSSRMDPYTETMLKNGVRAMIGKGGRSETVRHLCREYRAVYLATFGGAGAYLAKKIRKNRTAAFEELGTEALYEVEMESFPAVVKIDANGKEFDRIQDYL